MGRPSPAAIRKRARRVRCLFLDIDGVLTDGKLYLGPNGEEFKTNYVRDGYGIKHVVLDNEDKLPVYERIRDRLGLADADCAVMGDDAPDLPVMARVGLALTVADAHPVAMKAAHWASRFPGGRGAVREACDMILAAQGKD